MNNIIQQISEKLTKKILEKAYSGGICDIDLLSSSILEDCKSAARDILEAIVSDLNIKIREDKPSRKARGLILKEKNRERSLLTEIGRLNLPRDYYYDKKEEKYDYLLDKVIGLQGYERISAGVMAKLVSMATEVSYAKSAETVTGGQLSRQCVRECILKLGAIEKRPQPYEPKRKVKELHLFADEDHVHMQREGKTKGKKSRKNWRKTVIAPRRKLPKFWKHIRQCWGTGGRLTATAISKTGFPTFAAATGYIIGEKMSMLTKKNWRKRKTELPGYKITAKSRYFN